MSEETVPSPETAAQDGEKKPLRVIDFLNEHPGTLTNGYTAGAMAYDKVLAADDTTGDTVDSETHGETLRKVFALLGFELTDKNLADQLTSIGVALETLVTRANPMALLLDPMGPVQNAYTIGLLSGVALSNQQAAQYEETPSFGPRSPDQE